MTNRYTGGVISATAPTVSQSGASGVWNLEEAQYYQKAGLWPPGSGADPYFQNTTLLLHGDGTNGAQNNTFLDSSNNAFPITRNGNTTQGSFNPYVGPGCWSAFFNGSTDYLALPASTGFNFGTSDFTIEAWVYPTARVTNSAYIIGQASYGVGSDYIFCITNTGILQFYMTTGGANIVTSVGTIPLNTWTHVAVSRSGTAFKLFINGVIDGTLTSSVNITNSFLPATIGNSTNNTGSVYFPGYISNLRVVKGAAVYTAAFTPSITPIVATTQTALLTCNNNGFNDLSGANYSLTRAGSTLVSKFSPFTLYQTNPASYSGYFDGTGDYLSAPSNTAFAFGTGDFTIECWFYLSSLGVFRRIWWFGDDNDNTNINASNQIQFGGAALTPITGSTISANTWYHLAYVRSSGSGKLYLNGAQVGSTTANAYNSAARAFYIGATNTGANAFVGCISNLRITKGQALYSADFTPSTSPLTTTSQGATAANVSLLTCQSTSFIDNSTNAFTITATGNARPRPANPFTDTVTGPTAYFGTTYGGSSYFDGTSDYLIVGGSSNLAFGSNNFTIEMWLYPTTNNRVFYDARPSGTDGAYTTLYINGSNQVVYYTQALDRIVGDAVKLSSWNHIALVRSGGTTRLYVNGSQSAGWADGIVYLNGASRPVIGTNSATLAAAGYAGYVSNLRVVNGAAIYTTPFVPPTAPVTAITNTQLLVNSTNGGIFDNTTVNDLETVGSAQVSTTTVKYGTGSMYFNGVSGTGIRIASNPALALGSGDWTIECWAYYAAIGGAGNGTLYEQRDGSATAVPLIYLNGSTLTYYTGGAARITGNAMSTGQWYHIAVCRASGSTRMFVDGTQVGTTYADTTNYVQTAVYLGSDYLTTGNLLNGYIDDLRVTKGYARYTANFTPPAAAFPNF